jgi:hypothetical protein
MTYRFKENQDAIFYYCNELVKLNIGDNTANTIRPTVTPKI